MVPQILIPSVENLRRKSLSPLSLFEHCLFYVARNATSIESLVGFPEQVGRQIFKIIVASGKLTENSSSFNYQVQIWEKFLEAYRDQLLSSLNAEGGLLFINEYQEPLLVLLQHVEELNLKNCYLGPSHDVIIKISQLTNLKKLNLCNNRLDDIAIKRLTRPARQFKRGPQELTELDLSQNKITDEGLRSLKAFKKLEYLDLTATEVTDKGIKILAEELNMYLCKEEDYCQKSIETHGWATEAVTRWRHIVEERRKLRRRPLGKYAICRGYRVFVAPIEEKKPPTTPEVPKAKLLFKKQAQIIKDELKSIEPSSKCVKELGNSKDLDIIDIMAQYRQTSSSCQMEIC